MQPRDATALLRTFGVGLAVAGLGNPAAPAGAYHTNFQGACNSNGPTLQYISPGYERLVYAIYAVSALGDGYQYGGGCWNNNDIDESPGDPQELTGTRGEGPDCSGLVFKSWHLNPARPRGEQWNYGYMTNVHGPYASFHYQTPGSNDPFFRISKADLMTMDAVAKNGHVALYYGRNYSNNRGIFIESKGEAYGTGMWERDYLTDGAYEGVRRKMK
ncbi:MAG: hypothetical protein SGJ13_02270 [Actinomycetota bacterium]|nr:hypothetical protein [Actinomycetota bacterium]